MIRLYDRRVSGNCWKVRLMLGMAGLAYTRIEVDILAGEARTPDFLAINPRGQVPVLDDAGTVVWDSQAILAYLAARYAPDWLPGEPVALARVMGWLAVAGQELQAVRTARGVVRFGLPGDLVALRVTAAGALAQLDRALDGVDWLAGGRPTIADLACYPYAKLAPEIEVPGGPWPGLDAWLGRVEVLPGYVPIDG